MDENARDQSICRIVLIIYISRKNLLIIKRMKQLVKFEINFYCWIWSEMLGKFVQISRVGFLAY